MIKFEAFVDAIQNAVVKANEALRDNNVGVMNTYFTKSMSGDKEVLTPQTVTMTYPQITDDGVVVKEIQVPLLTLAPMVTSQIDEFKFTTNLEVMLDNDELQVGFGRSSTPIRKIFENSEKPQSSTATIEIVIKPQDMPEGFRQLVEGYEKVLRAQLPH